jgi:GNAT superfamily N-acetyltransferase
MEIETALRAYDEQLRRRTEPPAPGWVVELLGDPAPMRRITSPAGSAWGDGVVWTDLDESNADAAIASAVAYFGGLGRTFEWKHHGYDRPADLPDRLRAAGFEPDDEEALVVGEVSEVRARLAGAPAPDGVTIRRLRDDDEGRAADWQAIGRLHTAVWGEPSDDYVAGLSAEHAADPQAMSVWLAVADDGTVVCAARANFHEGTDFVSLWGGSTLAEWRGRGIYKALVSRRADEAAERGYRYLQVDASDDSRPILERLGLRQLTTTTPYMWRP